MLIFQASRNFFLPVLKKNFKQDCQNCIPRVQIDLCTIFKKKLDLIISSREVGQKFFDYSEKNSKFVISTSTEENFEKKLFFDINFIIYFRSLNGFFQNLATTVPETFSKQYFTCPVQDFEENGFWFDEKSFSIWMWTLSEKLLDFDEMFLARKSQLHSKNTREHFWASNFSKCGRNSPKRGRNWQTSQREPTPWLKEFTSIYFWWRRMTTRWASTCNF